MKIDVLGTKYNLRRVNYNQDEFMRKMNYGGYCDNNTKEIVILNLRSTPDKAWAKNEEMVDWFAIQFPKMYEAFRLAGGI